MILQVIVLYIRLLPLIDQGFTPDKVYMTIADYEFVDTSQVIKRDWNHPLKANNI